MNTELIFSSENQAWSTQQSFYDQLNEKYNFDIDVCAEQKTAKCEKYFTKEQDCLKIDWFGWGMEHLDAHPVCFMNPPYGRELPKFVEKAYKEGLKGCTVVCLIPARTDTKIFHKRIWDKEANKPRNGVIVEFLEGRLTFGTDEYWQWVWEQPELNGKQNRLYKKYGKKNSAPFPSMVVIFNK